MTDAEVAALLEKNRLLEARVAQLEGAFKGSRLETLDLQARLIPELQANNQRLEVLCRGLGIACQAAQKKICRLLCNRDKLKRAHCPLCQRLKQAMGGGNG